jgi:hypothetical protein
VARLASILCDRLYLSAPGDLLFIDKWVNGRHSDQRYRVPSHRPGINSLKRVESCKLAIQIGNGDEFST